jgi:hypothetical protein
MPSETHEAFLHEFHSHLLFQLRDLAASDVPPVARFFGAVVSLGSRRMAWLSSGDADDAAPADAPPASQSSTDSSAASTTAISGEQRPSPEPPGDTVAQHEPDACYGTHDDQFPGVVVEVAYSQKAVALCDLAANYIVESDGDIKMVIGVDLDYKGSRRATFSVWQPRYEPVDDVPGGLVVASDCVIDAQVRGAFFMRSSFMFLNGFGWLYASVVTLLHRSL